MVSIVIHQGASKKEKDQVKLVISALENLDIKIKVFDHGSEPEYSVKCPFCEHTKQFRRKPKSGQACSKCGEFFWVGHTEGTCLECGGETEKMPLEKNKVTKKEYEVYFNDSE